MVLCYSRMLYVEFTVSQTMEQFLACHQHAFDFFGGIPHKIMVDNLKSAVLKRTVGAAPYSIHNTWTLPRITALPLHRVCWQGQCERPGGKRRGLCQKAFLAGLDIPTSAPSIPPRGTGSIPSPMCACTAKPARNRPYYGTPSGPYCVPCHLAI